MHKRRRNYKMGTRKFVNANSDLPSVCRDRLKTLCQDLDGEGFAFDYLRAEYLSKFCGKGTATPEERRSAAIRKWMESERINADTNQRLRGMDRGYNILPRVSFYNFLRVAQRFVENVLGDLFDEVVLGSFSGGASTGHRRTESLPAHKFCGLADVTKDAIPYVDVIHRQSELYRQYHTFYSLREVEGAVLFTVPKKSDIDRCACKEPEINMYLQKGVGSYIRTRLKRFGVDLNDQSINRRLAMAGSIFQDTATIDLSSASDRITISCVEALLPRDWFLYLNDIRSKSVIVDGVTIDTQMFSSMGNGFTFELESLIFWALAKATAYFESISGIISVYGDDIIIPVGMYDSFTWVLTEFGFSVNPDKSFHTGPFRESCGGHYHNGDDVTPFYLRREPTKLTDLIRILNRLRVWLLAVDSRQYESRNGFLLWKELSEFVPEDLRGGYDPEVDTQLVDNRRPVNRLVRITKDVDYPQSGAYLHWHTLNRNRTWEADNAFPPKSTNQVCRRRSAKPGAVAFSLLFREEY